MTTAMMGPVGPGLMRRVKKFILTFSQVAIFPKTCRLEDIDNVTIQDLGCLFARIFFFVGIALPGAAVVIFFIIGGIRYMVAGGDEKAIAAARRTLFASGLGFILIIGAATLLWIIGQLIRYPNIIQFNIPGP